MEYLDRQIVLPEASAKRLPETPVRRGDIDFNGHMNNARYLETPIGLLPPMTPSADSELNTNHPPNWETYSTLLFARQTILYSCYCPVGRVNPTPL